MIKNIYKNGVKVPYSKQHKEKTRQLILKSAYQLFATKGYDLVTIDDVMLNCGLTRGGFYAHFASKTELYDEALKFGVLDSVLVEHKDKDVSINSWFYLVEKYLSIEHVKGERPCPLAFLVADISSQDKGSKSTYQSAYLGMNTIIKSYFQHIGQDHISEQDIFALTSMIIGAVAISRGMDDDQVAMTILESCRQKANSLIESELP